MTFIALDPMMGEVDLSIIDPVGPGIFNPFNGGSTSGRSSFYLETLRGNDPNLGAGTFVFAKFSGTIAAGTWVEFTPSLSNGQVIMSATAWVGTANAGRPLGIAVASGVAGQWGWFQVQGNAISTVSGAPAAGNPVYWQAAGVVSPTGVNGKQALGANFSTAVSQTLGSGDGEMGLSATQAVVHLCFPHTQGQTS